MTQNLLRTMFFLKQNFVTYYVVLFYKPLVTDNQVLGHAYIKIQEYRNAAK